MGKIRTIEVETAIEPEKLKKIEAVKKEPAATAMAEREKPQKPPRKRSNRYKKLTGLIDRAKLYGAEEAIQLIKKTATTKFDAAIEAHINLGLQMDKPEHAIRTLLTLPHPTSPKAARGKPTKILVFTDKNKEEIKKLGAEVGTESTLKQIEAGKVDWAKLIADPSWMPKLAKVARVLGPKGLMPSPKSGTVADEPLKAVKEFSGGRIEVKTEKFPIIHIQIAKASFTENQIKENFATLIEAIQKAKPESLKKELIKSVYLSSSMGPSIKVNPKDLTPK